MRCRCPGRTFTALAQTAPGVTGVGGGGVNAGGQLNRNNSYRIDGVSNDNNVLASPRGGLSMEAVREYIVIANQFSAEHGDASGALVSVVTRAGTNKLQGRALPVPPRRIVRRAGSVLEGPGLGPGAVQPAARSAGSSAARSSATGCTTSAPTRACASIRRRSSPRRSCRPIEREVPNPSKGDQFFVRTDNRLNVEPHDVRALSHRQAGGREQRRRRVEHVRARRRSDQPEPGRGVQPHRRALEPRASTSCASSSAATSPTTSCARRSTQPTINRPSGNFGKPTNQPQGRTEDRWQFVNNFSYTLSAHDLKVGLDYSRIRATSYFNNNTGGTFTFATDRPFDANDLTTYPTQYTQNIGDPNLRRPNDAYGVFAQDSWHVRPNFTLNYGLRYDHETAFKEATGVEDASLNIAPRFGFAWDPRNNQKTVVRGGIGQYYSKVFLNITGNIQLARALHRRDDRQSRLP